MREDRTTCMLERREAIIKADKHRSKLLAIKRRKNDIEKMKRDREITNLDITTMNAMQQQYFFNIQKEIFEESKKQFSSGSPSPSSS